MERKSNARTARAFEDAAPERTAAPSHREGQHLTTVRTHYLHERRNFRVLFGRPLRTEFIVRRPGETRLALKFAQGTRFALDLWARNSYGTVQWRCFVCEAIGSGEEGVLVPTVTPAARVLLHTKGAAQSRLVLAWFRELELGGINLATCVPETFEAAQFRLLGSRADRIAPQRLSGRL